MSVPEYDLELDHGDYRRFNQHAYTNRFFPAALTYGNERLPIWIGYRGRLSRDFPKPSYEIWLQPEQMLDGHRRFHLNAAYRDPSLLRGRLAFEVFAALGLPVPRAWHVWVTLNRRPMGLYTAIESLDQDWFRRQGCSGGAIYYSVGGDGNFGLINPRTRRRKQHVALGYEKCCPYDDDFSDLETLIYQITLPKENEFEAEIDRVIDVECCLRWLIGVMFMSHTDGLTHNYALLRRPDQRWELSPWDCDGTWGRTPYGHRLSADDPPIDGIDRNYLAARLLASSRWRRRYGDLWADLLDGPLAAPLIEERLHSIYAEIRSAALNDARKWRSNSTFAREPNLIRRWVSDRTAFIQQQLADMRADSTVPP